MLRAIVLGFGAACILGAIVIAAAVPQLWPAGLELILFGLLIVAGILFERHYRGGKPAATAQMQHTGERFIDPTSGKLTEVYYDPKTGQRIYKEKP